MAYALVGSLGTPVQSAAGSAVSGLAYGQSPTAGNLLVCWWIGQGATTAPTSPSGWASGQTKSTTTMVAVPFVKIAAGGDAVPTFAGITSSVQTVMLAEFSGNANAGLATRDQLGSTATTATTNPLTAALAAADAKPGELVMYVGGILHSGAVTDTASTTVNSAAGSDTTNNASSTVNHYCFGYAITTSNATADSIALSRSVTSLTSTVVSALSFILAPAVVLDAAQAASQATVLVTAAAAATPTASAASQASATVTAPTTGPTVISAAAAQATAFVTATVGLDPAAVTASQATATVFTITPALLAPVAASATLATVIVFNGTQPLGPRWAQDTSVRWLQDIGVRWAPDAGVRWVPAGSTTYYGGAPETTFATDLDGGGPATAFTTTIDGGVP